MLTHVIGAIFRSGEIGHPLNTSSLKMSGPHSSKLVKGSCVSEDLHALLKSCWLCFKRWSYMVSMLVMAVHIVLPSLVMFLLVSPPFEYGFRKDLVITNHHLFASAPLSCEISFLHCLLVKPACVREIKKCMFLCSLLTYFAKFILHKCNWLDMLKMSSFVGNIVLSCASIATSVTS